MLAAAGPPPLPLPPADCSALELGPAIRTAGEVAGELGLTTGLVLFRVGGLPPGTLGHPLLYVAADPPPRHRFDDPASGYLVWYGSRTADGAFLEVFGDTSRGFVTPAQREGRLGGWVRIEADARLLDLRAPAALGILRGPARLDDRIGTTGMYSLAQAWSERIFGCDDRLGGLIYRSRLGGDAGPNVAIFLGRTAGMVTPLESGTSVDDPRFDPQRLMLRTAGIGWG